MSDDLLACPNEIVFTHRHMIPAHDRQLIQVDATARDDLPLCVLLAGQQCLNSVPAQNLSLRARATI